MSELDDALTTSARNAILSLAAAEIAVSRGNFNAAKVFRATALSERIAAVELARVQLANATELELIHQIAATVAEDLPRVDSQRLERTNRSRRSLAAVLAKAEASLKANPDVLEADVHQFVWGCHLCGSVTEGGRPETCSVCGALGPDFELFAPYFAQSNERIGRLGAAEIVESMRNIGTRLEQVLRALNGGLDMRTSANEWSPREIVAHMTETDMLFAQRARAILADPPGEVDGNVMPWLLHRDKGYELLSVDQLLARQRDSRAASLAIVEHLTAKDWNRRANLRGAQATLLDFGTWVANHDIGHLEQIKRFTSKQVV